MHTAVHRKSVNLTAEAIRTPERRSDFIFSCPRAKEAQPLPLNMRLTPPREMLRALECTNNNTYLGHEPMTKVHERGVAGKAYTLSLIQLPHQKHNRSAACSPDPTTQLNITPSQLRQYTPPQRSSCFLLTSVPGPAVPQPPWSGPAQNPALLLASLKPSSSYQHTLPSKVSLLS